MATVSVCVNVLQALLQLIIILLFCYSRRENGIVNREQGVYYFQPNKNGIGVDVASR
jgi:hypothetical protein